MVKCEFCINYINGECIVNSKAFTGNPLEDIDCDEFIDKAAAMYTGMFLV